MHYDANKQPDSEIWLELDEAERIDAVMDYHAEPESNSKIPNSTRWPMWW